MDKKLLVCPVPLILVFWGLLSGPVLAESLPGWLNCVSDDFGNMTCSGSTQMSPSGANLSVGSGVVASPSGFDSMGLTPQPPVFRPNDNGPAIFNDPFVRY